MMGVFEFLNRRKSGYLILLVLIILLAIFLRTYRLGQLSIFLADQAIMSTQVLEILRGHFTLLGPKASIGNFYFGPIVYYLMVPFYYVFSGYPLAGTIFKTILQILTIPVIYLMGKRVRDEQTGVVAGFVFSASALLIDYSRATFNTTTALFFAAFSIFIYFSVFKKFSWWRVFVMGIILGWVVQMNFITSSLFISIALFPAFFNKKLFTFKYYFWLVIGVLIGLSPYLLFELRHDFFNTREILNYIFGGTSGGGRSFVYLFEDVPVIVSSLLYGTGVFWAGVMTIVFMVFASIAYLKKGNSNVYFNFLLFLLGITLVVRLIYGKHLESIYFTSVHTSIIVVFSVLATFVMRRSNVLISFFLALILLINMPNWNLQKSMHDLQDGLSMADFDRAGRIIQQDTRDGLINTAMEAQRDNRAMPLRYFLYLYNVPVMSYENYAGANSLYFIVRKNRELKDIGIWEFKSFGPTRIVEKWIINDEYVMYKLAK